MSNQKLRSFIRYFPIFGCIAIGISYVNIGCIALLSFFKVRDGGADESSMLAILNDTVIGKVLLWIILVGTVCYIVWRFFESATDPYGYGNNISGLGKRFGIALSTVADLLIVKAAIKVILGIGDIQQNGVPYEERKLVEKLLAESWGNFAVMAIGATLLITALVQLVYGLKQGYKERVDIDQYPNAGKRTVYIFAWIGFCSRGIIISIIGIFLVKAALTSHSDYVVNTDKAFDYIGDNIGHAWFILVAIGTVCYGIFMVIHGLAYDHGKD